MYEAARTIWAAVKFGRGSCSVLEGKAGGVKTPGEYQEGKKKMTPEQQKMQKAVDEMIKVAHDNALTGGEYLCVLETLAAAALAANKVSLTTEFITRLKKNARDRRVAILAAAKQEEQANVGAEG